MLSLPFEPFAKGSKGLADSTLLTLLGCSPQRDAATVVLLCGSSLEHAWGVCCQLGCEVVLAAWCAAVLEYSAGGDCKALSASGGKYI